MRQRTQTLLFLLLASWTVIDARRVRYKTRAEEEPDVGSQQVDEYYTSPTQPDPNSRVVLVSSDTYNGLYGRPTARAQTDTSAAEIPYRSSVASRPRAKDSSPKQPPVQTIRNYSKVNDDGSFTFGYEAADGSFKEETRGTDCVVRGKYGYVDPDGNKREFTYVSGNPCDPNSVGQEEDNSKDQPDSDEENVPKVPIRPLRPLRPTASPRPTTTLFQQSYSQEDQDDSLQSVTQAPPRTRYYQPTISNNLYQTYTSDDQDLIPQRPLARPQSHVRITPRPPTVASSTTVKSQLPATTYRPQLVSITPRPSVAYTTGRQVTSTPTPFISSTTSAGEVDFDEELRKFQIENNVLSTPSPAVTRVQPQQLPRAQPTYRPQYQQPLAAPQGRKPPSSDPIYTSELVYDPSSGQYNTVLYQQLPQTTGGEVNLKTRLQAYVAPQLYQQQPSLQQQHANLLQQSQLYQQQRALANRYPVTTEAPVRTQPPATLAPQRFQYYQQPSQQNAQVYYVSNSAASSNPREPISQGQIDAFLRGHNINF